MDWTKYNKLFGLDLSELNTEEPIQLLMTYEQKAYPEKFKTKMRVILSITTDINNLPYEQNLKKLDSTEAAGTYFKNRIGLKPVEYFEIAYLDKGLNLIKTTTAFKGGLSSSLVDVRELLKEALSLKNVKYIITAHNHPSGHTNPSFEDEKMISLISKAFKLINIEQIDSVIVSHKGFRTIFENKLLITTELVKKALQKRSVLLDIKNAKHLINDNSVGHLLKLEEKIGGIIGVDPSLLTETFNKTKIPDLKITPNKKHKLELLKEFSKELTELKARNYLEITEPDKILDLPFIKDIEPGVKIGIVFLNTMSEAIFTTIFNKKSKTLEKDILKAAFLNNAYSCIIVETSRNENLINTDQEYSLYMTLKENFSNAKLPVFDSIIINSKDFKSLQGRYQRPHYRTITFESKKVKDNIQNKSKYKEVNR